MKMEIGRLIGGAALGLLIAPLPLGIAQGQPPVTLEAISKAWKQREDRVRSARFEWSETITIPKGFLTNFIIRLAGPEGLDKKYEEMEIPKGSIVPPRDTTYSVPCTLDLKGDYFRYSRENQNWSGKRGEYVPSPSISTYNGKIGKSFMPKGVPYLPNPSGQVHRRRPLLNSYMRPILMTFRGVSPEHREVPIEDMKLTGRRVRIGDRPCVELQQDLGLTIVQVWVDPGRDYVPIRQMTITSGKVTFKVDATFRVDETAGWVPDTWDVAEIPGGDSQISRSVRAKMISYKINAAVEDSDLELEFPPWTRVVDEKAKTRYLTKEDGGKRMIPLEDANKPYSELLQSELRGDGNSPFLNWRILMAIGVAVIAFGLLVWRRCHSRAVG